MTKHFSLKFPCPGSLRHLYYCVNVNPNYPQITGLVSLGWSWIVGLINKHLDWERIHNYSHYCLQLLAAGEEIPKRVRSDLVWVRHLWCCCHGNQWPRNRDPAEVQTCLLPIMSWNLLPGPPWRWRCTEEWPLQFPVVWFHSLGP